MDTRIELQIFDENNLPKLHPEIQGKALPKSRGPSVPIAVFGVINECGKFDIGNGELVHFKTGDLLIKDLTSCGHMRPLSKELFASQYGEHSIHLCPVLD